MARAQGISPALLGRRQWRTVERATPGSPKRKKVKQLRAQLWRIEMKRDILKKS